MKNNENIFSDYWLNEKRKNRFWIFFVFCCCFLLFSCTASRKNSTVSNAGNSATKTMNLPLQIDRKDMVKYAKTFLGTPYKYGSSNPKNGFDCSGFVFHVLTSYGAKPPRSSFQYENYGKEVKEKNARPGDIILFTGSDNKKIGHMGFVTENKNGEIKFIHSATSKGIGVVENYLQGYYRKHFVKIVSPLK